MKYLKPLALLGLVGLFAIGFAKYGTLRPVRQVSDGPDWQASFGFPRDFQMEIAADFSKPSGQAESESLEGVVADKSSVGTPATPDWFHPGWTESKQSRLLGVSLEGQTSVQSAMKNLKQLLREEILRELGYANPTDLEVLPQLSLEFIGSRLIPKGHLLLLPYEDDVTREAAALRNQTPVPYYRGFAEASLGPSFFRLVERWKRYPELRESLKWIGLSAGGVLASLVLLFGYLKADHVTHSHYTKRLQTFFAIVFLAVAALFFWLL